MAKRLASSWVVSGALILGTFAFLVAVPPQALGASVANMLGGGGGGGGDTDLYDMRGLPSPQNVALAGLQGSHPETYDVSGAGVRYATGENILAIEQMASGAMNGWTHSLSYVSRPAHGTGSLGGGWRLMGLMQLVSEGGLMKVITANTPSRVFHDNGNGTFTNTRYFTETLFTDSPNSALVLRDSAGTTWNFGDFTVNTPAARRGHLKSSVDPAGNTYTVTYGSSGVSQDKVVSVVSSYVTGGNLYSETWAYDYYLSGGASGRLQRVTLQRSVNGGSAVVVRKAEYTYYASSGTNGPANTLQWAKVMDASSNVLDVHYFRYNPALADGQLPLRYALSPTGYGRALASLGSESSIDAASDATLSQWARLYSEYDTQGRVSTQILQGHGANGSRGTYTYAYTDATHGQPAGFNTWKRKTVETLPDGNQNIVYSGGHGNGYSGGVAGTIIRSFKEVATGNEWKSYSRYDNDGRVILKASQAAMTGYSESYFDLVNWSEGTQSSPYIADGAGLVGLYEYWSSTNLPSGQVSGFASNVRIKQGDGGTAVVQETMRYTSRTGSTGGTIYPLLSTTVYRNTDGTGPVTTSYAYTWVSTTTRVQERTTTQPAVTTAQNGSDSVTASTERYDTHGRTEWARNADGFIVYTERDPKTGAISKRIVDVNTAIVSNEPAGWTTPAGGGLHLTSQYRPDDHGRITKVTDPNGNISYTVYKDTTYEVRTYRGWTGTTTTGPIRVSRQDRAGSYSENFTMSATPATSGGEPTGAESVSSIESFSRQHRDTGDRPTHSDDYFTFSGLSYGPSPSLGVQGTHFLRSSVNYNSAGLEDRMVDPTGTVSRTYRDALGRVKSVWIGTDDTPTSGNWSPTNTAGTNLNKVSENEYDQNAIGNGNLTKSKSYTSSSVSLDTVYTHDFRNRVTNSRGPSKVARRATLDNLGRMTVSETYADADQDFVIDSGELREKEETKHDEKSQVYQIVRHNVDPSSGSLGNRLTTNYWYNARGMAIKKRDPNGILRKSQYDGAGRLTASYVSYHDAETAYGDAQDVVNDTVISEEIYTTDANGNPIQTASYFRTSDATLTGSLAGSTETNRRRTYKARWVDSANRVTSVVDYGRNGGAVLSRPSTAPAPNTSDAYIVTKHEYNGGGELYRSIDNKGRIDETLSDLMGRVTKKIGNRDDGVPSETELDKDLVTETTYDSSGRRSQLITKNPKGSGQGVQDQITKYVFGTDANEVSPAIWRNDVLVATIYPDSDDTYNPGGAAGSKLGNGTDATYDRIEMTLTYAGELLTMKDQRGVVRTTSYNAAGLAFSDAVTTVPAGVHSAVLRLETTFNDLSLRQKVTSYDAAAGGNVVNEVKFTYDGWGNEQKCEQAHAGAVVGGTPAYQKTFADGAVLSEAKYVRTTSLTYPNGRVVHRNFPSSGTVGDRLSRVDNLANDSSGTTKFAQYTYLGRAAVMLIAHPQVSQGLNYDLGIGEGNPTGWDDLGRVDDNRWKKNNNTDFDRYQYGFDRTSARKWRDNLLTTVKDEHYAIDGLDRATTTKRGNLNAGKTDISGTPAYQEAFNLEGTGNWRDLVQTTSGTQTLNQTRAHNAANETGVIGATVGTNWIDPVHDLAGNMTQIPQPAAEGTRLHLTYDAWNRLAKVQADAGGSPGATVAEYLYNGLHQLIAELKPNGANWNRKDRYFSCEWQVVEERELLNTASKTMVATTPKYQWVWDLRYQDAVVLRDENKDADGDCVDGTDQRLYYTQDANFNTTALLTTNGTVVERYVYESYGKVSVLNGSWATQSPTTYNNEVLYGGYRFQPETGLYQVRHRVYHPTLGRWLQRDPLGYQDGPNLHQYVSSSPINRLDPQGLHGFRLSMHSPAPWGQSTERPVSGNWREWDENWRFQGSQPLQYQYYLARSMWGAAGGAAFLDSLNAVAVVAPPAPPSTGQKADLDKAIKQAKTWVKDACDDLVGDEHGLFTEEVCTRFNIWFGPFSEKERRDTVKYRFMGISNWINSDGYKDEHIAIEGEGGSYAFTSGEETQEWKTHIYDKFWQLDPVKAPSTQAGTLIHELGHAIESLIVDCGPNDQFEDEYKWVWIWSNADKTVIASNVPRVDGSGNVGDYKDKKNKINNADSYKYFAEKVWKHYGDYR